MKFILLTEGKTEKTAVGELLHRAVNRRLSEKVGVSPVSFDGSPKFLEKVAKKAQMYLTAPDAGEIIAIIGLLDLYGLPADWQLGSKTVGQYQTGKEKIEKQVGDQRFQQFFAVHETEAWLLSDPTVFPQQVRKRVLPLSQRPETVDFNSPPAKRLNEAYLQELKKRYRKVTDGHQLFAKLDPDRVLAKCPYFKTMIDKMIQLAKAAGA